MDALLEYENQIYLDMFHNDALLVMAEGLGIERIFSNFIKLYCDPTNLVIILNTHEAEEQYFTNKLKGDSILEYEHLTKITTETHSQNERSQVYLKGGCFFVTSRILVVDMLTDRIPIDLITGILVYNAHKIIDSCQETFILRMFRQKNKKGFIKAFSDNPIYFTKGFSKVERVMKNLFVKKLFIYPRFHIDVESELTKHKPDVIEIHVGLSENSSRVQMALMDILNVLLQEFKGCCSYIDHDFLTMEMVISRPFDQIVKAQLEPVWNQLGSKPKQLISDIRTLRLLLYYLTQYDSITFFKMLNCLKSHEKDIGRSSGWMFLDAANELFTKARIRVYGTEMRNYSKPHPKSKFKYSKESKEMTNRIIQESPKLKVLKEILEELGTEENTDAEINILIVANDDRTCSQIKHFLRNNRMTRKLGNGSAKASKQFDKYDITDDQKPDEKEDEFIVKMILKPLSSNDPNDLNRQVDSKISKILKQTHRKNKEKETVTLTQMVKKTTSTKESNEKQSSSENEEENGSSSSSSSEEENPTENQTEASEANKSTKKNTNLFLSALEGGTRQKISLIKLLFDTRPKYVILYDSQLWFVRQLEVIQCLNYKNPMRVYFMIYTNSSEEQRYLTSIRTEKESFEILIREKANMIVTEEQDGKLELPKETEKETIIAQANSRKGGIAQEVNQESEVPKIIVDMREFRSELPSILHKRGFHIEPCTLEVGDYVLTPNITVERKSINDLIESLANGRLYNQCNSMSRSYKTPVLLIEFDSNKPFQLNSYQALASNEISTQHTSSKLALLTIHFPKLRILWCSSPSETAEIFEELKANSPQPDAETAMSIKTDQVIEDEDMKFNPVLKDILLKIPGIDSKNVNRVITKVKDLCALCVMSEEELTDVLENSKAAKIVFEFLNKSKKGETSSLVTDEVDFEDLDDFYSEESKKTKVQAESTKDILNVKSKSKGKTASTTKPKAQTKSKKK
ncbi:unnamed protein product [Brachionus calyciflorus]|uniref:DNA repair endonuclease XPF n=1 Tax=Brachionus calyciflorus TaxID=104777 RepID=A0A813Q8X9_9BILA|nr:unnamed protein product [Brachionus calyciflorus]